MPSISTENYLKALYHLGGDAERVSTTAIAEHLSVSLPSATNMMKSLSGAALVDHVPYRGTKLTDEGRRTALRVIRKHRLIEVFLVEVLGYRWDEVHEEAERLEHAVSDTLADRIDRFLAFPAADPHGDPIPTSSGEIRRHDAVALTELADGAQGEVVRVLDQDTEILQHLATLGVRPGATIELLESHPFDGPLHVRVGEVEGFLGRPLARRVLIRNPA